MRHAKLKPRHFKRGSTDNWSFSFNILQLITITDSARGKLTHFEIQKRTKPWAKARWSRIMQNKPKDWWCMNQTHYAFVSGKIETLNNIPQKYMHLSWIKASDKTLGCKFRQSWQGHHLFINITETYKVPNKVTTSPPG